MYKSILEGIKNQNQIDSKKKLKKHLKKLKSAVKKLRTGYKNTKVDIDYSDTQIQESYMISYFPHYTAQFEKVVNRIIKEEGYKNLPTKIISIGGGPCPEIVGYLKCLKSELPNKESSIKLNILDKFSNNWTYSHNITFNQITKGFNPNSFDINFESNKIDISKEKENLEMHLGGEERIIVSAQNFLNEINCRKNKCVVSGFMDIFSLIPKDSYLILSDFYNYGDSKKIIKKIEKKLKKENTKIIRSITKKNIDLESPYKNVSSIIKKNLLTGKNLLRPKSNIKFCYSIIKKQ